VSQIGGFVEFKDAHALYNINLWLSTGATATGSARLEIWLTLREGNLWDTLRPVRSENYVDK
jgi:hypothetical protein